jgi:hypothetical protein
VQQDGLLFRLLFQNFDRLCAAGTAAAGRRKTKKGRGAFRPPAPRVSKALADYALIIHAAAFVASSGQFPSQSQKVSLRL